eukprot:7147102-Heterocapsa_arctica.AAC.1
MSTPSVAEAKRAGPFPQAAGCASGSAANCPPSAESTCCCPARQAESARQPKPGGVLARAGAAPPLRGGVQGGRGPSLTHWSWPLSEAALEAGPRR